MGQKIHPIGFRLGFNKPYHSLWFARSNITRWCWLMQDKIIRDYLYTTYPEASIKQVDIHRYQPRREIMTDLFSDFVQIYIYAAKPMIINETQTEKDNLINKLQKLCEKPQVLTSWIPRPLIQIKYDIIPLNNTIHQAYGIADNLIEALEKRTRFRQALKKTIYELQENPPKYKPRRYNRKGDLDQRQTNQYKNTRTFDFAKTKNRKVDQEPKETRNQIKKITTQKARGTEQKKSTKQIKISSNRPNQKTIPLSKTQKKSKVSKKNKKAVKSPKTQLKKKIVVPTTRIKLKKRIIHYKRIKVENHHKRKQRFNSQFVSTADQKRREKKLMYLKGVRIQLAGRLNGAEMARVEWYKQGRIPLQTLRANIDYVSKTAKTTHGILGIKVWTYHGEQSTVSRPGFVSMPPSITNRTPRSPLNS
jgi:ribosomal protein S3